MARVIQLTDDLAIGKPNPQREYGSRILNAWLAQRKAEQAAKTEKKAKNFAAAKPSRLNAGWGTVSAPSSWHIWNGLRALRARSREAARNNGYARKFIAMCKDNIVGHAGFKLQSRAADFSGPDKLAQAAIEEAWRKSCKPSGFDVTSRLGFAALCQQIIATVAVDGECLVRLLPSRQNGIKLQLIDPEWLDIRLNQKLPNGNIIRMGVEFNTLGRAVAYHILEASDIDVYRSTYAAASRHIRLTADELLHLYRPESIDQVRGVPWMASALLDMKHLDKYIEAAVVAARVGASKMGFFTSSEGGDVSDLADDEDAQTDEFIQEAVPAAFDVLPEGYSFTSFNPDYPHQQFADFVKQVVRSASSGMGVNYNTLANDGEGISYSTMRSFAIEDRERWKSDQAWFIDQFVEPLAMRWLESMLMLGNITVPSSSGAKPLPASKFEKFANISIQGRRWSWVDPAKEMDAFEKAIQHGLKSRAEIIRDMGRDPDEVWEEIKKEREALKALGILEAANEQK